MLCRARHTPHLINVRIREGETPGRGAGACIPGTPGLTGAQRGPDTIIFYAGSGSDHFVLTGAPY